MDKLSKRKAVGSIIILLIGLGVLLLLSFYNGTGKISYQGVEDGYEIILYNKWNRIVKVEYSPVEPVITGQNYIYIDDDFVGSLVRDYHEGAYYMGIQSPDGTIRPAGIKEECSNLILYGDDLYFINASVPSTMQNIWRRGSGKGKIMRTDKELCGKKTNILTGEDELTNCFFLWNERIYYQVVQREDEENTRYHIYSRTLEGTDKKEVYSGLNWTTDFTMDDGIIFVSLESKAILRVDVEQEKENIVLSENDGKNKQFFEDTILEIVSEDGYLHLSTQQGIYRIRLEDIQTKELEEIDIREVDIQSGVAVTDERKILQRVGDTVYVYKDHYIYKTPFSDDFYSSIDEELEEVGIEIRENKEWEMTEDTPEDKKRNHPRGIDTVEENGVLYTADLEVVEENGGIISEDQKKDSLYRIEDGEINILISYPTTYWDGYKLSHINYYEGYIYYMVIYNVLNAEDFPSEYHIYRIPEQGGEAELLDVCLGGFMIYQDKMYYETENKRLYYDDRSYWETDMNGKNKRLLWRGSGWNFAVGGGSIYVETAEGARGINLTTGQMKKYTDAVIGLKYEDGYLYYYKDRKNYRVNLKTEEVEEVEEYM